MTRFQIRRMQTGHLMLAAVCLAMFLVDLTRPSWWSNPVMTLLAVTALANCIRASMLQNELPRDIPGQPDRDVKAIFVRLDSDENWWRPLPADYPFRSYRMHDLEHRLGWTHPGDECIPCRNAMTCQLEEIERGIARVDDDPDRTVKFNQMLAAFEAAGVAEGVTNYSWSAADPDRIWTQWADGHFEPSLDERTWLNKAYRERNRLGRSVMVADTLTRMAHDTEHPLAGQTVTLRSAPDVPFTITDWADRVARPGMDLEERPTIDVVAGTIDGREALVDSAEIVEGSPE